MGRDNDKRPSREAAELRQRAENELKVQGTTAGPSETAYETQRLLHELQIHQIELEMQNLELRQSRDELEETLESYTDLYDFAPIGYFTLDREEGGINAANLTGATLLGVERSLLVGRRFGGFLPAGARPFFSEFLRKVFSGQGKESCEVPVMGGGNRQRFVQIEAVAEASGNECRIAVIDITERRHAEAQLIEKRKELEELNQSLELRIDEAVEELRKKDRMLILQDRLAVMGEMINNIAHQWRQPLNALGLIVQQAPMYFDLGECTKEFLDENTARAMALIRQMSQTVDDFRNLFRPNKEEVTFSVNQVIGHTLSFVEKGFKEQDIAIACHSEDEPMAKGYPNEYSQVLLNILMNARDALLANHVAGALISIRSFKEGARSVVTVTDNAGGIAEEIMARLFEPYFTTKGPDKGTGIGLYMSKTIIEKNMGGRLTARNTESGAEFRIEV